MNDTATVHGANKRGNLQQKVLRLQRCVMCAFTLQVQHQHLDRLQCINRVAWHQKCRMRGEQAHRPWPIP